jgi:hypothetical protein
MTTRKSYRGTRTAALVLAAGLMSGSAKADFVITDDLIVQGSTCTGLDCKDGEVFNFDTLILKENNLRILFLDTSTLSGFPTNDWRLIANDSASGGANFFAIQDATASRQIFQVTAGAAANSLFVGSNSKVGLRTSTPVLDLHINTSDTPGHRLEQNNSGGFSAQTWDIAGNEANFFVRDVTGGSRLPFRIRPGAPTSSIDINASGNVGVGTASPSQKLQVGGGTGAGQARIATDTADLYIGQNAGATFGFAANTLAYLIQDATKAFPLGFGTIGSQPLVFGTTNNERVRIAATGEVGIGTNAPAAQLHTTATVRFSGVPNCASGIKSDAAGNLSCIASSRQFKTIAGDLAPHVALANIMALRPQTGSYKDTPEAPEHWLIAEETAAVDPALVGLADGKPFTVKTQNVVADLIAVVQQQQRRIEALEQRLAQQEAK